MQKPACEVQKLILCLVCAKVFLASDFSCLYFGHAMQLVIIVACLRANGGVKLLPNNRTASANIYAALGLAWHGLAWCLQNI